jgi:glycosyltransferase involved in cell wall biosynthesis
MGRAELRGYQIPLSTHDRYGAWSASFLGFLHENDKTWAEIETSLTKAKKSGYNALLLPLCGISNPHFFTLIPAATRRSFEIVIQVSTSQLVAGAAKDLQALVEWAAARDIEILWNLIEDSLSKNFKLSQDYLLPESFRFDYATVVVTKVTDALTAALHLQQRFAKLPLYFHFPVSTGEFDLSLSMPSAYETVWNLRRHLGEIQPPPGQDLYDPRVQSAEGFEPLIEPEFISAVANSSPRISVIIPTFNNALYLKNVLFHLRKQDLSVENFEVLIVDDGSSDESREAVLSSLREFEGQWNLRYYYFKRHCERRMGDLNFRAAIARNIGAKDARGEFLLFLDSDILVPSDYLADLLLKHESYDVIQGARLELIAERSSGTTRYESVDPALDTYAVDKGYWLDFISQPDWNSVPLGWKYTCTHSLSLRADLFKEVGWLRKVFVGYGHEDSDLGFRLWRRGCRFWVNRKKIYHLFHSNERSEFSNSHDRKLVLLRNTAKIFYFNTLHDEVYKSASYLFSPDTWVDWMSDRLKIREFQINLKRQSQTSISESRPKGTFPRALLETLLEIFKVALTLLVTLFAPLEVSYHEPKHRRFWRPLRIILEAAERFRCFVEYHYQEQRLLLGPKGRHRALLTTLRHLLIYKLFIEYLGFGRLPKKFPKTFAVYYRVRWDLQHSKWRKETTAELQRLAQEIPQAFRRGGWAGLFLRLIRVCNPLLLVQQLLKLLPWRFTFALQKSIWHLSYPIRKLYYVGNYQLRDFDRAQLDASRNLLLSRARRLGADEALRAKLSFAEEIQLLFLSIKRYLELKKRRETLEAVFE